MFQEHRISVPDGLRIYVRDFAPQGQLRGDPILCLHGLTRNSKDFEGVVQQLTAQGRRVLAMDVRGRGNSDWDPQPARYQPPVYAGDVIAVLATLAIPKAVFIGTSMGGLITMILAAVKGDLIAGAVLNDIGPIIDPRGISRLLGYTGKVGPFSSWKALADQIKALQGPFYPGADDAFWMTFARRSGREKGPDEIVFDYDPAIAQTLAQADAPAPDLMPLFAALAQKPVLVIRGALSDILSEDGLRTMRAAAPAMTVCEVPRVGHAPTLEEPQARAALTQFLSGDSVSA